MTDFSTCCGAIRIIDATLREGAQAPGVSFTPAQSAAVAGAISGLGVDMIECGHPAAGSVERERVAAVCAATDLPVMTHARARIDDIRAAAATPAGWIGVFVGINAISREARLSARVAGDLDRHLSEAVAEAKSLGLRVRFTVEDGGRTRAPALIDAFGRALEAGADRICLADTVGSLTPARTAAATGDLAAAFPEAPIELHLHDDRGLALANALAGAAAGATWISTTVNGVGERCGIVDTLQLLINLRMEAPAARAYPAGAAIARARDLVAAATGSPVHERHPCTGAHAFTHGSDLHRKAVARDPGAYQAFDPAWTDARHSPAVDEGDRHLLTRGAA